MKTEQIEINEIYCKGTPNQSVIECNTSDEGEWLETKILRIVGNSEPITDGAPTIYTERINGVEPAYNPRTDRFDIALDALEHVHKSAVAKRAEGIENRKPKPEPTPETTQTTGENQQS